MTTETVERETPARAFRVWLRSDARSGAVYTARSASQARYRYLLDVADCMSDMAFADARILADVSVRRAQEYDVLGECNGIGESYAQHWAGEIAAAERWNAQWPVGTPVRLRRPHRLNLLTRTRSPASMVSRHAVVWVEKEASCWGLEFVEPLALATPAAPQGAEGEG